MQVMDRMAKMQALKRESVIKIRDAYGRSRMATDAANHFHSMAKRAKIPERKSSEILSPSNAKKKESEQTVKLPAKDQVPLLKCGILIGGASGTCYVTSRQALFVTQTIPILGGIDHTLLNLSDLEFILAENQKPSLIFKSPPNVLSVRLHRKNAKIGRNHTLPWIIENTDEVFSFAPDLGSRRFIKLIDMIKSVDSEDPETLKFSSKGGLIYMADDKNDIAGTNGNERDLPSV